MASRTLRARLSSARIEFSPDRRGSAICRSQARLLSPGMCWRSVPPQQTRRSTTRELTSISGVPVHRRPPASAKEPPVVAVARLRLGGPASHICGARPRSRLLPVGIPGNGGGPGRLIANYNSGDAGRQLARRIETGPGVGQGFLGLLALRHIMYKAVPDYAASASRDGLECPSIQISPLLGCR